MATMFKEGDTIRMKTFCSHCEFEELCILHYGAKNGRQREELFAWGGHPQASCSCKSKWELVTSKKTFDIKKSKWGVSWIDTKGHIEFFTNEKIRNKRVGEILSSRTLDKNSFILFEVGKILTAKHTISKKAIPDYIPF